MKKRTLTAVALCCWLASGLTYGQGNAETGQAKSAVCAGCHGANGKAILPEYPNLAGQHASYTAKQLREFRDGLRNNAMMAPMAMNLSDQDIQDLAIYYAGMAPIPNAASEENLDAGKNIYRGGITSAGIPSCMGCHGPAGDGNPAAQYPTLAGQNAAYTALQLKAFRAGERNNDPNGMMRALSHRVTDSEIEAVANYIAGLH